MSQKHELVQKLHSMAALIFSHQPVLVQPAPKYISFVLSNNAFKRHVKLFWMFLRGLGIDIWPGVKIKIKNAKFFETLALSDRTITLNYNFIRCF